MNLPQYRIVFIAVGLLGVLLIASPLLGTAIRLPAGEPFSELYILGPGQNSEGFPFNVVAAQNYSIYVGVNNHLGSLAYYTVFVKLRNETDLVPNATLGTPSPIQPVYEYKFVLQDGNSWQSPFTFSFENIASASNQTTISKLTINGEQFSISKPAELDPQTHGYNYQFVFELWLYDTQSNSIQYNNRFVDLQLNCTNPT